MINVKKLFPVLALGLAMTGCVSTDVTRLTPMQTFRTADNTYPIEAIFDSNQQSLRWETIQGHVLVGNQTYDMQLTKLMTNRWETLVPVPPGTKTLEYRIKFTWEYNAFGSPPQPDSKISKLYKLQILDN